MKESPAPPLPADNEHVEPTSEQTPAADLPAEPDNPQPENPTPSETLNENEIENENHTEPSADKPEENTQCPPNDSEPPARNPAEGNRNLPSEKPVINRREYSLWELIRHRDFDTLHPENPDPNAHVLANQRKSAWDK